MEEIWKDINGYEGYYQVSNMGNIKSMNRTRSMGLGRIAKVSEKIMIPNKRNDGYLQIFLRKEGKYTPFFVHRLVAIHFIPNTENKPQVNHKKGNKSDNRFFMLEWNTCSENLKHSYKNGTHDIAHLAKLNPTSIKEIKTKYSAGGISMKSLAVFYKVDKALINRILKGRAWSHVK